MKALLPLTLGLLLTACAHTRNLPQLAVDGPPPNDAWDQTLEQYVDPSGYVDFSGLSRNSASLDRYLGWIGYAGPNSSPAAFPSPEHKLAYHINAYNALAMRMVVAKGIPQRLTTLGKVDFFYLTQVRVDGESISLYAYENDVIRGFNEPRIHFALNCMSVGCPRLPREPFDADRLDEQLDRETRKFFAATRNLRVDHDARTVYVNELLEWFEEDFLAVAPSLIAYIDRYTDQRIPGDYQLEFLPYDWTVVRQGVEPGES